MGRLTWKRDLDGFTDVGLRNGVTVGEAICRLADYESTGLEPEELQGYKVLCDLYVQAGFDAKFVQACIDAVQSGVNIDHLRELVQAEKDGKLDAES